MLTIYGLPNCDSTKAAIKYFKQNNTAYALRDLKSEGITRSKLQTWLKVVPLDKLLNKKSTTWRSLAIDEQATASTIDGAIELMQAHTSLIKRPVIEMNGQFESVGSIPGDTKK